MKNLKKLTRTQKEIVLKNGLTPNEWGVIWANQDALKIQNRKTGEIKYLEM